jgi:hypothetical protein
VVRAWLNLTDDPDSYMIGRDDRDDPATESHIPCPKGAQLVVDTERFPGSARRRGRDVPRRLGCSASVCSAQGPGGVGWRL